MQFSLCPVDLASVVLKLFVRIAKFILSLILKVSVQIGQL